MTKPTVYRLIPDRERITRSDAAEASAIIARMPGPQYVRERLRHELYRLSEPDHSRSPFGKYVMLSVQQVGAIWDAIRALAPDQRPQEVRHAFDLCILNLRQDTGEVMLTRDELAERMNCSATKVSHAMGVLEDLGVIIKQRRRVQGMRGPGIVAYFVNPHAAWNGTLANREREAERQEPPLLQLMKGGKE